METAEVIGAASVSLSLPLRLMFSLLVRFVEAEQMVALRALASSYFQLCSLQAVVKAELTKLFLSLSILMNGSASQPSLLCGSFASDFEKRLAVKKKKKRQPPRTIRPPLSSCR